ncbi:acryloyl-CoA reductase [Paenibacillus sp. PK4536]|uniref:acrylyl-CoA reductase family protein n=1 Tax=Paenibacillus sp. PK4536 TaxID=3024576 RepID=UPI002358EE21|nr:acryloyl-CoA reductase [Paenibacillus sp. PK4536]WIM37856.1 acryloyl-CoA reductase [Paenibacillus sp. PK4536]
MEQTFRAFVLEQSDQKVTGEVQQLQLHQLPEGSVTIKVSYSDVNYKDGLASIAEGKIVKQYPFVPGIDLAGEVVESSDEQFQVGDQVLCTGYKLGVSHYGGYSEYARVPAEWLIKLPQGLSAKEAMIIGTAGFTAGMSVDALIQHGIKPEDGPILVTGSTGGVGTIAISILSALGYEVYAASGKADQKDWLTTLGASQIISREEAEQKVDGPLGKSTWAGIIDPTGGKGLGERLKSLKYRGVVAVSGMTAGNDFESSVFPFILRGAHLIGIDSVFCPIEIRQRVWKHLASDWKPTTAIHQAVTEYTLEQIPQALETILAGKAVGRQLIKVTS